VRIVRHVKRGGFGAGLFALAALPLLAGCLPQAARIELAPNEKLLISRAVWDNFLLYQQMMRADGAFVVNETGDGSGYVMCPYWSCQNSNYARRAIDLCEQNGVKCVVFARGLEILVDYEIVD
jgi:hypothetical protein